MSNRTGIGGRPRHPRPEDFAAIAPGKTCRDLEAIYGVCHTLIRRWRAECGLAHPKRVKKPKVVRERIRMKPYPPEFAALAPTMYQSELARRYGRDRKTILRWLTEAGVRAKPVRQPKVAQKRPIAGVMQLPTQQRVIRAEMKGGLEEDAAQYLRRFYLGVHHCNERGGAELNGKLWRCGNAVLTADELIRRAEAKGWDPEGWKRIDLSTACPQSPNAFSMGGGQRQSIKSASAGA